MLGVPLCRVRAVAGRWEVFLYTLKAGPAGGRQAIGTVFLDWLTYYGAAKKRDCLASDWINAEYYPI